MDRPNIIFIYLAQHNAAVMGNAGIRTPNIDELAQNGIKLDN